MAHITALCLVATLVLQTIHIAWCKSANVVFHADDKATVKVSRNRSNSFTEIFSTNAGWPVSFDVDIEEVTADTIVRFEVTDLADIGGFIATFHYGDEVFSTTNPIGNGNFKLISSSDGVTSPLVYHSKTSSPWNIDTDDIDSDAYWIWNEKTHNTMIFEFDFGNGIAPTVSPTALPTLQPTSSLVKQFELNGSYVCSSFTESIDLIYGIDDKLCMMNECMINHENDCVMSNFVQNNKINNDSRCYIFDKQCKIIKDVNGDSKIHIRGYNHFCNNYPQNWKDSMNDQCGHYVEFGWCENGIINDNITESRFISHRDSVYNITAIDSCCDCGGGIEIFDDVSFAYSTLKSNIKDWTKDLLCFYNVQQYYGNKQIRNWNNLILYQLCESMKKNIGNDAVINCTILVDSSYNNNNINHTINISLCQYDDKVSEFDFVFIYGAWSRNQTSIFINMNWFNISISLISSFINVNYQSNSECYSLLTNSSYNNPSNYMYGIFPCNLTEPSISNQNNSTDSIAISWVIAFIITIILVFVICLACIVVYILMAKKLKKQKQIAQSKTSELEKATTKNVEVVNLLSKTTKQLNAIQSENNDNYLCINCCNNKVNVCNIPCGHMTYCTECYPLALQHNKTCPTCRQNITQCITVFKSGLVS